MPTESRILKSPLAVAVGGWEQVDGGWSNTEDPGYQKMLGLVRASIGVPQYHNACGTCNRVPCECRGCWVRHARTDYRKKLADNSNSSAP